MRDVIHRFHQIGPACPDPRWTGGRPRLLCPDSEDFAVQTATTRPTKPGQPFTRRSIRTLLTYLRKMHGRVIRIGHEALHCLLARRGSELVAGLVVAPVLVAQLVAQVAVKVAVGEQCAEFQDGFGAGAFVRQIRYPAVGAS